MHHTIGRIAGNIEDYIICKECGRINWFENDECVGCASPMAYNDDGESDGLNCRWMVESDREGLLESYDEDEYDHDSIELEV